MCLLDCLLDSNRVRQSAALEAFASENLHEENMQKKELQAKKACQETTTFKGGVLLLILPLVKSY